MWKTGGVRGSRFCGGVLLINTSVTDIVTEGVDGCQEGRTSVWVVCSGARRDGPQTTMACPTGWEIRHAAEHLECLESVACGGNRIAGILVCVVCFCFLSWHRRFRHNRRR